MSSSIFPFVSIEAINGPPPRRQSAMALFPRWKYSTIILHCERQSKRLLMHADYVNEYPMCEFSPRCRKHTSLPATLLTRGRGSRCKLPGSGGLEGGLEHFYVPCFCLSQQYHYLSIVQTISYRAQVTAAESQSFRFSVKIFRGPALAAGPKKLSTLGPEPALGGLGQLFPRTRMWPCDWVSIMIGVRWKLKLVACSAFQYCLAFVQNFHMLMTYSMTFVYSDVLVIINCLQHDKIVYALVICYFAAVCGGLLWLRKNKVASNEVDKSCLCVPCLNQTQSVANTTHGLIPTC